MNTAIRCEMSYHAREERLDRLASVVEYLGMSKIIFEAPDRRYKDSVRCLTSTGIIFVKDEHTGKIITGFMATVPQVMALYMKNGYQKVPPKIYARVKKNNERFSFLLDL